MHNAECSNTQHATRNTPFFILHPSSFILIEKLPFLVLSAASCVVTLLVQAQAGAVSSLERVPLMVRVANALMGYAAYLHQTIWPSGLAIFYPLHGGISPYAAAAGAVLLVITVWAIAPLVVGMRRRGVLADVSAKRPYPEAAV